MSFIIGSLIGAGIGALVGKLASTGKEMYRDNLISQKEMEEIKAKSKAFEQLINHYKDRLDKAYNLEVLFLEKTSFLIETTNKQISDCLSTVGKLDDNSPKLEFYMKSFLELQNGVRELTRVLHSSEAKYFNNGLLKNT
ncbi:MAG: hypothetical protein ACRC0Y_08150, partial [Fusobacteriaceae bacterium]